MNSTIAMDSTIAMNPKIATESDVIVRRPRSSAQQIGNLEMMQTRKHSRHSALNHLFTTALLAVALGFTGGCGKNGDSQSVQNHVAVTPLSGPSAACAIGAAAGTPDYRGRNHHGARRSWSQSPHAQMNVVPYGYENNDTSNNEYCGCPAGTQAMCDGQYGLVCLPVELIGGQDIAWWRQGQGGFEFSGYGGYSAYTNVYDPRTNLPPPRWNDGRRNDGRWNNRSGGYRPQVAVAPQCSSQIGQTCTVGTNSCGQNSHCQPVAPNQPIGICVR